MGFLAPKPPVVNVAAPEVKPTPPPPPTLNNEMSTRMAEDVRKKVVDRRSSEDTRLVGGDLLRSQGGLARAFRETIGR